MKKTTAATLVYLFILSVLVGGLLLAPMATASSISAEIDFDPDKFNLRDGDGDSSPVMAFIRFPKPDRQKILDINASTVLIDGAVPIIRYEATRTVFKAFFNRDDFEDYLWFKMYHMGYVEPFKSVKVKLEITGKLYDETLFVGSDTILVSAK